MSHTHLPICTQCYAVRVEPSEAKLHRPVCLACRSKQNQQQAQPKEPWVQRELPL